MFMVITARLVKAHKGTGMVYGFARVAKLESGLHGNYASGYRLFAGGRGTTCCAPTMLT